MACVDEGDGPAIVFLHGSPTSSGMLSGQEASSVLYMILYNRSQIGAAVAEFVRSLRSN